jgi:hypothetical protein
MAADRPASTSAPATDAAKIPPRPANYHAERPRRGSTHGEPDRNSKHRSTHEAWEELAMCRRYARCDRQIRETSVVAGTVTGRGACSAVFCWAAGAGIVLLLANGCADAPRRWVEDTEDHTLPTVGTRRVSIKTTNGYVQVRPAEPGAEAIKVHAIIRASGRNLDDAEDCRQAIEIAMPVAGGDEATQEITWAWGEPKQPSWSADVSFEIVMPVDLHVTVASDNGRIDVVGLVGDCDVKSDNGAIRVVGAGERLNVETTNGEVTVDSPAADVNLKTTNGQVRAKLTNEHAVAGKVVTTNGSVTVALAKTAAVDLACRTVHGSVKNKLPLEEPEKRTSRSKGKRRTQLNGKLAGGGATLDLETTNGDIVLEPYVPRRSGDR